MGGVGKSQLALEYAYRHEKEYNLVYWIRSEEMQTLKADYRILGLEMGIGEDFLKDENVISTIKGVLENRKAGSSSSITPRIPTPSPKPCPKKAATS